MVQLKEKPSPDVGEREGEGDDNKYVDLSKYTRLADIDWRWRRDNPEIWAAVVRWALGEAKAQRPFAIKTVIEQVRWKDRVNRKGEDVRVNNSIAPLWSRLIVMRYPQVRPYIMLKPSGFDHIPLRW